MTALQKDLLYQAASMLDCDNPQTKNLLNYSKLLFQMSTELLSDASKLNSILTGIAHYFGLIDKDGLQDKVDIRVQHALRSSLVFYLVPPLATSLLLLIARPHYEDFVLEILPTLVPLLTGTFLRHKPVVTCAVIDGLNSLSNDVQMAEKYHLDRTCSSVVQIVEIESPHK